MRKLVTLDADQLHAFATRYTAAWCSMDPALVAEHYASVLGRRCGSAQHGV